MVIKSHFKTITSKFFWMVLIGNLLIEYNVYCDYVFNGINPFFYIILFAYSLCWPVFILRSQI